jgi:hypothetical protein
VTFDEALKAVLEVAGCASIEEGSFIYVHPKDHVETVLKARRRVQSRVYELFYISAANGEEIVKPMLSEVGTVIALGDVEAGLTASAEDAGADGWAFSARLVIHDYGERAKCVWGRLLLCDKYEFYRPLAWRRFTRAGEPAERR